MHDDAYPASMLPVTLTSDDHQMNGHLLVAQGIGPHPTIVLLHGFPGYEQNGDLAQACRRAGWNVLSFHYRGAWGSQGIFSFAAAFEDVHAALAFLRSPQMREQGRVDAERLVLIGHSMGGFAALLAAERDAAVLGAASLAGFHFGLFGELLRQDSEVRAATIAAWKESLTPLRSLTAEQLAQEVMDHAGLWGLDQDLAQLARTHLLLLGASQDAVAPPDVHHAPLIAALEQHGTDRLRSVLLPTDHAFSDARLALAEHLLLWLADLKERTGD